VDYLARTNTGLYSRPSGFWKIRSPRGEVFCATVYLAHLGFRRSGCR
jgi:hypothetical protein